MTKISLTTEEGGWGRVRLGDDVHAATEVDTHPLMTIFRREVTGRDDDGNQTYSWEKYVEDVHVAMYESRVEIVDGIELMRVKVIALYQGEIDSTAALALTFGPVDAEQTVDLFRVDRLLQNGVRWEIEAERVL